MAGGLELGAKARFVPAGRFGDLQQNPLAWGWWPTLPRIGGPVADDHAGDVDRDRGRGGDAFTDAMALALATGTSPPISGEHCARCVRRETGFPAW